MHNDIDRIHNKIHIFVFLQRVPITSIYLSDMRTVFFIYLILSRTNSRKRVRQIAQAVGSGARSSFLFPDLDPLQK